MRKHIIAMGGGVLLPDTGNTKLEGYVLKTADRTRPRVLFVSTASGDDVNYLIRFYETYGKLECDPSHLLFFKRTPPDLAALVLAQHVIHVGGGNTRSMLAVWREWGFDRILREAYERGIVLCGSSAGSICWFQEGVTDSVAGELGGIRALGFLPGSHCPHYNGEKDRRSVYQRLVAEGALAPGYAADDGVALHFVDGALHAVLSARPEARAYLVQKAGARAAAPLQDKAHEETLSVTLL